MFLVLCSWSSGIHVCIVKSNRTDTSHLSYRPLIAETNIPLNRNMLVYYHCCGKVGPIERICDATEYLPAEAFADQRNKLSSASS